MRRRVPVRSFVDVLQALDHQLLPTLEVFLGWRPMAPGESKLPVGVRSKFTAAGRQAGVRPITTGCKPNIGKGAAPEDRGAGGVEEGK